MLLVMAIDRRTLLKTGLLGGGILAVSGVGVGMIPTVERAAQGPLQVLDTRAYSVLAAIADTVCPGGGQAPSASDIDVAGQIDAFLATCPPHLGEDLRRALLLFDNALAGLFFRMRPSVFTGMEPAARVNVLEGWRTSRLSFRRQVYSALRTLIASTYYGDPRTYAASGYPGPPNIPRPPKPGSANGVASSRPAASPNTAEALPDPLTESADDTSDGTPEPTP